MPTVPVCRCMRKGGTFYRHSRVDTLIGTEFGQWSRMAQDSPAVVVMRANRP